MYSINIFLHKFGHNSNSDAMSDSDNMPDYAVGLQPLQWPLLTLVYMLFNLCAIF